MGDIKRIGLEGHPKHLPGPKKLSDQPPVASEDVDMAKEAATVVRGRVRSHYLRPGKTS